MKEKGGKQKGLPGSPTNRDGINTPTENTPIQFISHPIPDFVTKYPYNSIDPSVQPFVRRTLLSASTLPGKLETAITIPSTFSQSNSYMDSNFLSNFAVSFSDATLFTGSHPVLSESYMILTKTLKDPQSSFGHKFSAFLLADALLTQIALPLEEKYVYKKQDGRDKKVKNRQKLIEDVIDKLSLGIKPSAESDFIYQELKRTVAEFTPLLEPEVTPLNKEQLLNKITKLDEATRVLNSPFSEIINNINPPTIPPMNSFFSDQIIEAIHNPLTTQLLLEEHLQDKHTIFSFATWTAAFPIAANYPTSEENQELKQLSDYFFTNENLIHAIWFSVINTHQVIEIRSPTENQTILKGSYDYRLAEGFFLQSPAMIDKFFQSIPFDRFPKKKDQEILFRNLVGFAGIFQTLHPNHENTQHIRESISRLADTIKARPMDRISMAILQDSKPGFLYSKVGVGALNETSMTPEAFRKKHPDGNIIYVSTAESASQEVKPQLTPAEKTPVFLSLPLGETINLSHWGDVKKPQEEQIATILTFLSEKFTLDDTFTENAFTRISEASQPEQPQYKQAVILPSLTEEVQPYDALSQAGVIAVQRERDKLTGKDKFTILLDPVKAGIAASDTIKILISTSLEDDLLVFPEVDNNFQLSSLHLALTETALASYRDKPAQISGGKVEKRFTKTKQQTVEWNKAAKLTNRPIVEQTPPDPEETAVVIPLDHGPTVALFTLKQ